MYMKHIVVIDWDAVENSNFYKLPPDQAGRMVMESHGVVVRGINTEEVAPAVAEAIIDAGGDSGYVCDTVLVWRDRERDIKMVYQERPESGGCYNIVASVLHPECHRVWGPALLIGVAGKDVVDLCREDVAHLLLARTQHKAVRLWDGGKKEVMVDNYWNVQGSGLSLVNHKKVTTRTNAGVDLVRIEDKENGVFYLAVLEKSCGRVFRDLTLEEYKEISEGGRTITNPVSAASAAASS